MISYSCPLDILEKRLIERGKSSGRADDNLETIKKRFQIFLDQSQPVIDYYKQAGKCTEILSDQSLEDVYLESQQSFKPQIPLDHPNLIFVLGAPGSGLI